MNRTAHKLLIGKLSLRRLMTSLLLVPLLVYFGLLLVAYFYSEKIIFQPQRPSYGDREDILRLPTADGERIAARFYPNSDAAYTILFSHGNAEDIGQLDYLMHEFQKLGFAALAYDYRGYGTSEGTPSEKNAYQDIDAAYDHLAGPMRISPDRIILYGRSLGGAVAIDLAARRKVGGLIVEGTFVSAFRVVTVYPVTPFDRFPSLGKIKQVKCPVLFIHGRRDGVVPFWHGERLFAAANEPKSALWLENAGHNDVYDAGGEAYLQAIRDFAGNLPK